MNRVIGVLVIALLVVVGLGHMATRDNGTPTSPTLFQVAAPVAGPPPAPAPVTGHASGRPIACPGLTLTQGYGPATGPSAWMEPAVHGYAHFHTGWDLACPAGTEIVSVTAGTAHVDLAAGCDDGHSSGFGRNVQIENGRDWIRYGHMERVLVANGQAVAPGTVLGLEGTTGCSTGPHLHFEVDRGCRTVTCSVDPSNVIPLPPGIG